MEPTIDTDLSETEPTEQPTESEEPEDEIAVDNAEINAVGDTYTLTIADYTTLKNRVTLAATVDGTPYTISSKGVITAKEGEGESKPEISLTITAKPNWKITEVKKDGTAVEGSSPYTITTQATATVTVTTVATYNAKVSGAGGTGIKVKTGDGADAEPTEITVAGSAASPAVLEKGKAMEFEVAGSTAVEGTSRLKVYYITDGSDAEDRTEIEAKTSGTAPDVKTTYTVPANVIDSLDKSIEIVLEAEEKVAVTVDNSNSQVDGIEVEVPKDGSTTEKEWVAYSAGTNNKVFPGEKFKFRVKTAANYVIKAAKLDDETTLTAGSAMTVGTGQEAVTWTPYEVTPEAAATVTFETELDTKACRTLTFKIKDNKTGTATAAITEVKATAEGAATTDADAMKEALGLKAGDSLILEENTPLSVLKSVVSIKVTVTATEGYALTKTGSEAAAQASRVYTLTGSELKDETVVEVATEDAALAAANFFKLTLAQLNGTDVISNPRVTEVASKVVKKGDGDEIYYSVAEGVSTISLKVDVAEGNEVSVSDGAVAKSITAGTPANKKVTYDIVLLASTLTDGGADSYAGAKAVTITPAAIQYTVSESEDCSETGYVAAYQKKDNAVNNATFEDYDITDPLGYNHALKAVIKPAANYTLKEVSCTMGGNPVPVTIEYDDSNDDPERWGQVANLNIAKVTGDVEVTVKAEKDTVKLGELAEVVETDANNISFVPVPDEEIDNDGIYQVDYKKKYVVDVTEDGTSVPAKDISIAVKDGSGAPVGMTTPLITSKTDGTPGAARRSFNLGTKNLAGQEITVEVSYKGAPVGTYIMQVSKKTTELSVNSGAAITQSVDSIGYYPIVTNGTVPVRATVTNVEGGTLAGKIDASIEGGELVVKIDSAKQSEIATSETTGEGENQTTTWKPMKAVIKVTSPDDADIFDEVEISATPLFAENATPTLTVDSSADVLMNVTVNTGAAQMPEFGSFAYTVTATPDPATAPATIPSQLKSDASTATDSGKKTSASMPVYVANSRNLGEGAGWSYKLSATVVYKDEEGNTVQTLTLEGDKAVPGSTDVPVFEDALKLKKTKNGTFYTGWSGELEIATPTWKNGKYQVLADSSTITDDKNGLTFDIKNGNIVVTDVAWNADLGKHTITVLATRDETGLDEHGENVMGSSHTSYASRATVSINVVKGINQLTLTAPTNVIYKDAKKKTATLKTSLEYNKGGTNLWHGQNKGNKWVQFAPKTKKVTWDIVGLDSDGNPMLNADESPVESAYIKQYVTIKNGTITVKDFVKDDRHKMNNHFAVRVKAADFAENDEEDWIDDMMVSTDKMEIAKVALVQPIEGGKFKVAALQDGKNVQAVKAADVDGAFVLAVGAESDAAVDKVYTYNQLKTRMNMLEPGNTEVKSNNKIANVSDRKTVPAHYGEEWPYLSLTGTNKKINLTVTATDGGKSKSVLPLSLEYTELAGKDLSIDVGTTENAKDIYEATKVEKTGAKKDFTVNGAARLYVTLKVGDKENETSTNFGKEADEFTNYKLAVKGGKKISDAYGKAVIVTTSEVTTITLTNPNVDKSKKEKPKVYTYTLTNKAYSKNLEKAPKITVKGQLYESARSSEQVVTMTAMNGKDPVGDLYARVEADWSALSANVAKNSAIYTFNNMLQSGVDGGSHIFKINKDTGVIDLKFDNGRGMASFTPGSYKVKVTVGTSSTEQAFVPKYLPANATIKVAKNKAFTFKPTTSYTINKVDGGAVLGGRSNLKDNEINMWFDDLQNENKKGVINKFTHYFKVVKDEKTNTQRLMLNEDDPLVQEMLFEPQMNGTEPAKDPNGNVIYDLAKPKTNPVITIPKEHLTGYIRYDVTTTKKYFTNAAYSVSGYTKITVKIAPEAKEGKAAKASQKYVPQPAEIKLAKDTSKTEVNLKVNGSYVSAAYAIIDESKAKSNAAELALDGTGVNDDGQLTFKAAAALTEGQKYSTNLLVVPANSWYARIIEKAPAQAPAQPTPAAEDATTPGTGTTLTKTKLIELYGIPVKITIIATANAKTTEKMVPEEGPGEDDPGDEPTQGEIATVIVSAAGGVNEIEKGATLEFSAAAKDSEGGNVTVDDWEWTVTGGTTGTGIVAKSDKSQATLTVAAGESAATLTVKAVAVKGTFRKEGTASISVKNSDTPTTPAVETIELTAAGNATEVTKGGTLKFTATLKDSEGNEITDLSNITVTWDVEGQKESGTTIQAETSKKNEATLTVAANEVGTEDADDSNKAKLTVKVTAGSKTQTLKVEVKDA